MEGSCCWRCAALISLMILGHFLVPPDRQVWARSYVPRGGAIQTYRRQNVKSRSMVEMWSNFQSIRLVNEHARILGRRGKSCTQVCAGGSEICTAAYSFHGLEGCGEMGFECNRDSKHSEVHSLELWRWFTTRRAIYSSSSRCGAPYFGAASTARACSRTAMKCKAACLSVYTFKLTSYVSLCLWVV